MENIYLNIQRKFDEIRILVTKNRVDSINDLLFKNNILEKIEFDYKLEFQSQEHWEYRKNPPDFSFAVGSCAYTNEQDKDRPGKSYGGDYFIYSNILGKNPDFMLWLGDNVYFREPDASKTGVYHRYTHDRALSELQPLLGSVHHYAIWDDHDYGPNNSDRSFIHKNITLQAFKDFWANPSYGIENNGGITTQFRWSDIDFFLLDNRFFRTPQNRKNIYREILGQEQVDWLIDALLNSKAPFKIVAIGGQFLNSEKVFENHIVALLNRPDATDVLSQIQCPTILICGRQDPQSPLSRYEEMQEIIPGSELVVIENCGHIVMLERPDELNTALKKWLQDGS